MDNEDGLRLSVCGSIWDNIVDLGIVTDYLLYILNKKWVFKYKTFYNMQEPTDNLNELMDAVEKKYWMGNHHNL